MFGPGFDSDSNMQPGYQSRGNRSHPLRDKWILRFFLRNFSDLSPIAGWSEVSRPTWRDAAYILHHDSGRFVAALGRSVVVWAILAVAFMLSWLVALVVPLPGYLGMALVVGLGIGSIALNARSNNARVESSASADREAAQRKLSNIMYTTGFAPRLGILDVTHSWNPSRIRTYPGIVIKHAEKGHSLQVSLMLDSRVPADQKTDLNMVLPIPPGQTRAHAMEWATSVLAPAVGAARINAIGRAVGSAEGAESVKLRVVYHEQARLDAVTLPQLRQAADQGVIWAGMSMDRKAVTLDPKAHTIIAATTGAGKSSFLHPVLMQLRLLGAEIHFSDLKNGDGVKSYAAMDAIASASGSIQGLWSQAAYADKIMSERYSTLARMEVDGADEDDINAIRASYHPVYLVVDEVGLLEKSGPTSSPEEIVKRDITARLMRNIAQRGRGARVLLVLIGQKITADVIPMHVQKNSKSKLVLKIDDEWTVESMIAGSKATVDQAKADLMSSECPPGFGYLSVEGAATKALRVVWMDEVAGGVRDALRELGAVDRVILPTYTTEQIADHVRELGGSEEVDTFLSAGQRRAETPKPVVDFIGGGGSVAPTAPTAPTPTPVSVDDLDPLPAPAPAPTPAPISVDDLDLDLDLDWDEDDGDEGDGGSPVDPAPTPDPVIPPPPPAPVERVSPIVEPAPPAPAPRERVSVIESQPAPPPRPAQRPRPARGAPTQRSARVDRQFALMSPEYRDHMQRIYLQGHGIDPDAPVPTETWIDRANRQFQ